MGKLAANCLQAADQNKGEHARQDTRHSVTPTALASISCSNLLSLLLKTPPPVCCMAKDCSVDFKKKHA